LPLWNPLIRKGQKETDHREKHEIFIKPPKAKGMTFQPKVLQVDPNHGLRWIGTYYLPWLFDGEHSFIVERLDQQPFQIYPTG
jgi:hypothetical protein